MHPIISILIIAHNEETHIRECIESVLGQSMKADEILLVAHNCTDRTVNIAQEYPEIQTYEYISEEIGPIVAREYGFAQVTGEIVACIDGDSYLASSLWLESIIAPFDNKKVVGVSGYPILLGNSITSFIFFLQGLPILRDMFSFYFWGANFACRMSGYQAVGGMKKCREIYKKLELNYPAEDCILSFLLQKDGKIEFARKAKSYVYPGTFFEGTERGKKQREDLKKIKKYFEK